MHDTYDSKERWASAGIYKQPEFDVKAYQKKIDAIVGVSPSGQSIVRLVWAWNARKWENTEWDSFGVATKGEWRQKYRALTVEIGGDDYVDISPPRWILEERYEPESIAQSWELSRYRKRVTSIPAMFCPSCYRMSWVDMDKSEGENAVCHFCDHTQVLNAVNEDVWGPVPRDGWYNLLPHIGIVAQHRNHCCKKAWLETREICYGEYKLPDGRELKRLKKAVFRRDKELATNPHIRPELNEVALQQAKMMGLQMMQDAKVRKRTELAEIRREHRYDHLNRVSV
jgi:hypothetical protein